MSRLLILLAFALLNCNFQKPQPHAATDSLVTQPPIDSTPFEASKAVRLFSSEQVVVFGDPSIDSTKLWAMVKFDPYISFEDFAVPVDSTSAKAPLRLKSNKGASMFRTTIREQYAADQSCFAGHYVFVWWGCGSPCQSAVIVDRRTGNIFDVPTASLGYEYKPGSRMLIVNPPDEEGLYSDRSVFGKPLIFEFDERKKVFRERKSR
jgi:hypothetical protein